MNQLLERVLHQDKKGTKRVKFLAEALVRDPSKKLPFQAPFPAPPIFHTCVQTDQDPKLTMEFSSRFALENLAQHYFGLIPWEEHARLWKEAQRHSVDLPWRDGSPGCQDGHTLSPRSIQIVLARQLRVAGSTLTTRESGHLHAICWADLFELGCPICWQSA